MTQLYSHETKCRYPLHPGPFLASGAWAEGRA
jgi:hypothetical protein